jgi:hypothetical protein
MLVFEELTRIDTEDVGELLGRPGPYELPSAVFEAVDGLRGDASLLSQLADTQPAAGPELLEPRRINFHTQNSITSVLTFQYTRGTMYLSHKDGPASGDALRSPGPRRKEMDRGHQEV